MEMNLKNLIIIVLMISIIIGISLQNQLVNDIEEIKWINRFNLDNIIILLITLFINNMILILGVISLFTSFVNNNNNKILIIHWLLILINTTIICNSITNTTINLLLILLIVDILSMLNIIFVVRNSGIMSYYLYQALMTIIMWLLFYLNWDISYIYYFKLGSGIGGYYIPNFYKSILESNISLMIYIGITNIILMYNPIFIFNNNNTNNNVQLILLINFILILFIIFIWLLNGYAFINTWLYAISFSTIVLSNIYYLFSSFDVIVYNLYYYTYYFTITSIIIWYIFLLSLYFLNNNNLNNSSFNY